MTPAEELHAQRGGVGIFAWDRREREVVTESLEQLRGKPGIDDILWGRALRIQDKMKASPFPRYLLRYTGAIALGLPVGIPNKLDMVGADGKTQSLPIELTLPEMILAGFALTRYCGLGGDPISKEEGTDCTSMVEQITNFANAP